ncbi:MAG: protein-L-isoaspartate(D-aspartate) O-methyltransferase [Gemmatimonadales bacterium]|nr:MAG: protein-L-isoaspartate(D-aspartate) O-methyltransferase [Gemmatimonadales bacterium]
MGPVGHNAYRRSRLRLIEALRTGGITDLAVLHAFDTVPRHMFVPEAVRHRAYEDVALPLGYGQTISRAGVHALHLQLAALEGSERVLEIGTGSGFQTALLSQLVSEVYSIEVVPEIATRAAETLADFGLENVTLQTGDGSVGWQEHAPYDRILVGAAAPQMPEALLAQLAPMGRMLIPIGDAQGQRLSLVIGGEHGFEITMVDDSHFVPLVGEEGW